MVGQYQAAIGLTTATYPDEALWDAPRLSGVFTNPCQSPAGKAETQKGMGPDATATFPGQLELSPANWNFLRPGGGTGWASQYPLLGGTGA